MRDSLAALRTQAGTVARAFAPLGWAFYGHWHATESARILTLLQNGASTAVVDEAISEVWNTQQTALLRNVATPLGRFGRGIDLDFQRRCQRRQKLVNEAIRCHEDGLHSAAMTLALTQVDGITRELFGTSFFKFNPSESEADYTDDTTLAGIDGNLPEVRKAFSMPMNTVGRHGSVSRHGIIHGMDLSFGSRVNSTKTLVLVGALAEHLESRAMAKASRWRRDRDLERSRLTGVDDAGRLLDDRHLEELYMFRAEFETQVFLALLEDDGPVPEELSTMAYTRLEQRLLSRRRFTLISVGSNGVAWKYLTPAGHWMGSAMRLKDRTVLPIIEERWTWDAAGEPMTAPWLASSGWTSTPGDPRTPNWWFGGFYLD